YHKVLATVGRRGVDLLEVGAGDRSLRQKMQGYWGEYNYKSCDIDSTFEHDFTNIDEVEDSYDIVCAFEMIEHLSLDSAWLMVKKMYDHVKPGGKVVLTTPNVYYPPAFLRDATHVTPFCYDELGGLLRLAGFRVVSVHRLYHDSLIKKFLRRILLYPVFRAIGIDYAKQIIVVADKPA
ncbi:MAG: methyltransferase domain-containing protein, partial [Gammaproteobacteria bacterium]|nr:methyltransferase domain-containing protein [Gammaproteobacteria bacterium]